MAAKRGEIRGADHSSPSQKARSNADPRWMSTQSGSSDAIPAGIIRVLVIQSSDAEKKTASLPRGIGRTTAPDAESTNDAPAPMAVETTAALARLGDPVEILRAESTIDLAERVTDPSIDLVLVDRVESTALEGWLAAIPAGGPPSVVVVPDGPESLALDAFRAGASDCVRYGADYDRVLPVVLLEQVRRWRADRQRRVSEQRIQWLENLYTGIVSEMPAALAVVDGDGLIAAVNPEFDRLFPSRIEGLAPTPEFLEARLPIELVRASRADSQDSESTSPGRPPPGRPSRASLASGRAWTVAVQSEDEPGETRTFELRKRQLDEEGRQILLISDVTESEWLSTRVESLRRDNRDIIENINSALIVVDPGGSISFANPAAERILTGEEAPLEGRSISDWFGSLADGPSPIEECLELGTRGRGAEALLRRSDGQWIPVGVSCSPRLDSTGQAHGVVAVFQDLSEIKELELQVRQTEKMASIGQLAAGVAHEVNNPMGFIHANLHQMSEYLRDLEQAFTSMDALQQSIAEGDLELIRAASEDLARVSRDVDLEFLRGDFEKALSESAEGAERIRHIVRDLRDFSRPDLPARSPADINQALESTANIVWAMMKYDVHLERDYGDLPKIDAYPMQLKQVFMNLLANGYQAIEARGDGLRGVMRIETREVDEEVVIRISDSGIGIAPEVQARIFEPFFTTKPVGAGTGLGLSTSYTIIERHGGRMSVESTVGEGTTFEVRLPMVHVRDGGD